MLTFECSAGAASYEVFMNGINSTNKTFRFSSNHACYRCMNRGSTIGKNMNYIMWKYDVPPKMCRGTYVAINKLITKRYTNNIKTDDDINASIIAECIMIRDDTMTCHTMNQCDAKDIVMFCTFGGFFYTPHLVLLCTK